jgi:hypothetical protein
MTHSPKRLLLTAVSAMILALTIAPMSFAGEDEDSGPTQAGETQGPAATSPATKRGPAPVKAKAKVKAVSRHKTAATSTQDVVRAKGGIQAGFGGMTTESTALMLPGFVGVLLILGAASFVVPVRRGSSE